MALDLNGIVNRNEFYATHYLAAILEDDLKHIVERWRKQEQTEERDPGARLLGLVVEHNRLRAQLGIEREMSSRLSLMRNFTEKLLEVLGYKWQPGTFLGAQGKTVPTLGQVNRADGRCELLILEVPPVLGSEEAALDPLQTPLQPEQFPAEEQHPLIGVTTEDAVTRHLLTLAEPPRWIIALGPEKLLLIDRAKWPAQRLLEFDLTEIFAERDVRKVRYAAILLHRDHIVPDDGLALLDTLDENSHRHAYGVSQDLKYALRESIELLGNEALRYLREVSKEKIYDGTIRAEDLSLECLRFMYRLLFLFYVEARRELGYAPINDPTYASGYSLEALRDFEQVSMDDTEAAEGFFLDTSLKQLFRIVWDGFPEGYQGDQEGLTFSGDNLFSIARLRASLFDPQKLPLLGRARLRNLILRRVIELMSLSRPGEVGRGRDRRRGRISYAQLGINQLGAVYEALLTFRGFFAEEDLFEVKPAGSHPDDLEAGYFVPRSALEEYSSEEIVMDERGYPRRHPKGSFIYRLAGRAREESASYYTPESLTRCVVKYALKELVTDKTPADEILKLTILEPAMGSAAFLNEAINQLSELYLVHKQAELNQRITHEEYGRALQKVKMYIADRNVFGVDLNPVAVELAEVSLWLNAIYDGTFVPWFKLQLFTGNSLIGARSDVYDTRLLAERSATALWHCHQPNRVIPGSQRPLGTVYHFLLPDPAMANYSDRTVKSVAGDAWTKLEDRQKAFARGGFDPLEISQLEELSKRIDGLWDAHIRELIDLRERTTDQLDIFGRRDVKRGKTDLRTKEKLFEEELLSYRVRNAGPYRRLKLVMDYWCALWFWPLAEAERFPTRTEYIQEVGVLLGDIQVAGGAESPTDLFPDTERREEFRRLAKQFGIVDQSLLRRALPRIAIVERLSDKYRFFHRDLEFADVFAIRGGFDLILGNPPWIKIEWKEANVLAEYDAHVSIRDVSAIALAPIKFKVFSGNPNAYDDYISEYESMEGTQAFLNATQNYEVLKGQQSNLYKCFLPQAWRAGTDYGVAGFLHPESVYDDPKGGRLRRELYRRLVCHYQFLNALKLFPIAHRERFSVNVYKAREKKIICFDTISNTFTPSTIDQSYANDGSGSVPSIKNVEGQWDTRGHKSRIISVTMETLVTFRNLLEDKTVDPQVTKLPAVHSRLLLNAVRKLSAPPARLDDIAKNAIMTECWHETGAQRSGTIRRETRFVDRIEDFVLSGPHFNVGNPIKQTPRRVCTTKGAYDNVDLTAIGVDYLQRTNYVPACLLDEYRRRAPHNDDGAISALDCWRVMVSRGLSLEGERTLQPVIGPPGIAHVDGVFSIGSPNPLLAAQIAGWWSALPLDFMVKITGKGDIRKSLAETLPCGNGRFESEVVLRILILNCLTSHYAPLWASLWRDVYREDTWTKREPRLAPLAFSSLTSTWSWSTPLRSDFARRQALIEIDVLVSIELGLSLEELKTLYQVQFPVLQENEQDTWYDRNGRIVFTSSRNLADVGLDRRTFETELKNTNKRYEHESEDDTQPGGPRKRTVVYEGPFDHCDRGKDYEIAWAAFDERIARRSAA